MPQYRGSILIPNADKQFDYCKDAIIHIDNGRLIDIVPAQPNSPIAETHPGCVWTPGFVDGHVHFPQTKIIGSASGELLPWLEKSVFPEEARFSDNDYAKATAIAFCNSLIKAGTTSAAIYSSSHPGATNTLFDVLNQCGLKALAGMTLMNRNAPDELLRDTSNAVEHMKQLIERWHGTDENRLRYCITPRFAISCTPELLEAAGKLAKEHNLWIQTHLSENNDEINFTLSLFPGAQSYLDVYAQYGLVGKNSLFAHCIHLSNDEIQHIKNSESVIVHCPDSNFFLGSGCMPLSRFDNMGINICMGSDVGAGRTFSMPTIGGRAYDVSLLNRDPISPEKILWLATVQAKQDLGFERSDKKWPDADYSVFKVHKKQSKSEVIDSILFNHTRCNAEATYVRGKRLRQIEGL